jgi:hypothetical protein
MFYILKGKTVVEMETAAFFEYLIKNPKATKLDHHIRQSYCKGYRISTVFLPAALRFMKQLLVFETMVFCDNENDPFYWYKEKYSTYNEAVKGHGRIRKRIRAYIKAVEADNKLSTIHVHAGGSLAPVKKAVRMVRRLKNQD